MATKPFQILSACGLAALLAVSGCAAPTTPARTSALQRPSTMQSGATRYIPTDVQDKIGKAQTLIIKGEKRVSNAEDDLDDGVEMVAKGEALMKKGNENVRESKDRYQSLAIKAGQSANPDQVADEAKRYEKIADRWEDALDDVADGSKLVNKGNKAIRKAESEISEGSALAASGRQMLRDAEAVIESLAATSAESVRAGGGQPTRGARAIR